MAQDDNIPSADAVFSKRAIDQEYADNCKLTNDDISIICSGEPNLWRTVITIYNNNSQEQAIEVKKQILEALKIKKKIQDRINSMQTHDIQSSQGLTAEGYKILGLLNKLLKDES